MAHKSLPSLTHSGFALLEVLIAVVVVSFGLLGLAGLQAAAMRNNHSAYFRSIATQQAYDIADRMRSNIPGIASGSYVHASGIPSDPGCISSGCTPAQLAQYDIRQWNIANASLLPSGAGVVCIDSTPDDGTPAADGCDGSGTVYVIKVWWDDEKNPANPKRFVTSLQPL